MVCVIKWGRGKVTGIVQCDAYSCLWFCCCLFVFFFLFIADDEEVCVAWRTILVYLVLVLLRMDLAPRPSKLS